MCARDKLVLSSCSVCVVALKVCTFKETGYIRIAVAILRSFLNFSSSGLLSNLEISLFVES